MSLFAGKILKRGLVLRFSLSKFRSKSTPSAAVNEQISKAGKTKLLRDIPGPSMVENLVRLSRDGFIYHHFFVEEMFERYGPIFRHSLPFTHMVYVSDPDDIEHVFRSEESDRPYRGDLLFIQYMVAKGLGTGLFGDDESWYSQRKAVAPKLLRLGALKPYFSEVVNVADDTIARFKEGSNSDLESHLTSWGAESIGVFLFGLRIGTNYKNPNEKAIKFIKATQDYFAAETKLLLGIPLYKYVSTPMRREAFRAMDVQVEITRHFLEKTRNEAATELGRACLAYRLENEDNISEEENIQICSNLFFGGIHTTTASTLLLIHALSQHPDVQQKAYEEIQRVVGGNDPTYEHLTKMSYLKAMIKENFRYSSNPLGNLRVLKHPVTVRGYSIPPGTRVVLSTTASKEIQKQKYGDPEKFSPERWLRSAETQRAHPFSNFPFGHGKRLCVGKRVAELEVSILLLRLLQKYEIMENKSAEDQPDWIFNIMVVPDKPYPFYLKKRN